jgi:hypothetical protein
MPANGPTTPGATCEFDIYPPAQPCWLLLVFSWKHLCHRIERRANRMMASVIPGRCQRVRAKRGPMTGSASSYDVQLHI